MEMAEGGEMNSDAIIDAMQRHGGVGDDDDSGPEEEEEVAPEPVSMGEDPWGAKSREEEWRGSAQRASASTHSLTHSLTHALTHARTRVSATPPTHRLAY